jgi:nicotinate-nucleotide--dimethylbenzimidazole phosphoribosyltransferase
LQPVSSTLTDEGLYALLDQKTKPPRSLGQLEGLAVRLAYCQQRVPPSIDPCRALVFAADHGISRLGVSAYPREVTAQMMHNFASGGAAVTAMARQSSIAVEVIDVGVDANLPPLPGIVSAPVARGTASFIDGAAMTAVECQQAIDVGRQATARAIAEGCQSIAVGEMGIGNTTSAAAMLCLLTGCSASEAVGRGTGVDDQRLMDKQRIVAEACAFHATAVGTNGTARDAIDVLRRVGGLEIAAMAGAMQEAVTARLVVIVDGFISSIAALVALRLTPSLGPHLFFSHRSAEAGHSRLLQSLDSFGAHATPMLDWQLRLGEASGAVLAAPLLRTACALYSMATFEQAGVSKR